MPSVMDPGLSWSYHSQSQSQMMPPADPTITTTKAPAITSKISDFFKPKVTNTAQLGNSTPTQSAVASNPPESCVPPAPAKRVERVPSVTRLTSFTINPPPPPPKPKQWVLEAVEIATRQGTGLSYETPGLIADRPWPQAVDPDEEFFFNPHEFEVQSVSRITAPAGRVVYQITWRDGHTAEVLPLPHSG